MPRARRWTDEQLAAAVAASRTLSEVHERLGLRPGKYDRMRAHIERLGLDASHIPRAVAGDTRRTRRWTDDDLRAAVARAKSVHDVIRQLGYTPNGGMFRSIAGHIRRLELDISHLARGTAPTVACASGSSRRGCFPTAVRSAVCAIGEVNRYRSRSTTSTATTLTTGWRTSVSCVPTAMP